MTDQMSDKEMLEYAAKAYGNLLYVEDHGWIHCDENGERGAWWRPLDDDGDAFRLAVKLRLLVDCAGLDGGFQHKPCASVENDDVWEVVLCDKDPYATTRRAVTGAAAEIGRNMP